MTATTLDVIGKTPLVRWSHRQRFAAVIKALVALRPSSILDYGAGDGRLFELCHDDIEARWTLYEPYVAERARAKLAACAVSIISNSETLTAHAFDVVVCQEVLEHIPETILPSVVADLVRLSSRFIIISVPIEIGPVSVVKNAVRIMTNRRANDTTFRNVVLSLFASVQGIARTPTPNGDLQHVGFDFRTVRGRFADSFDVIYERYSPIGGSWLWNSQYLLLLERSR